MCFDAEYVSRELIFVSIFLIGEELKIEGGIANLSAVPVV